MINPCLIGVILWNDTLPPKNGVINKASRVRITVGGLRDYNSEFQNLGPFSQKKQSENVTSTHPHVHWLVLTFILLPIKGSLWKVSKHALNLDKFELQSQTDYLPAQQTSLLWNSLFTSKGS